MRRETLDFLEPVDHQLGNYPARRAAMLEAREGDPEGLVDPIMSRRLFGPVLFSSGGAPPAPRPLARDLPP